MNVMTKARTPDELRRERESYLARLRARRAEEMERVRRLIATRVKRDFHGRPK